MRRSYFGWFLTLALSGAVGCGGGSEEGTESASAGGSSSTSGGESETPYTGTGDSWDGDPEGSNARTTSSDGTSTSPAESPWGSPLADQGTPLPERKPMNPSAQDSYRDGLDAAAAGKYDEARREFEDALKEDANAYEAAFNLGVISDRQGNETRALEYYKRALRIQPDYERAANGIVTIYIRRGRVADAVAFIEPLAKYWQRNLYLQSVYAETLVQANKVDQAIDAARAALHRDERFVPAMIAIIKASLKQGRKELASTVLDQALSVNPNDAELQYMKGQMLLEEDGRLKDALDRFKRAVQLRPDFVEARTALGRQLLIGANYGEALTHLQAAALLSPQLVEVHLNLADAYRANKQWQKAKAAFDKALEMKSPLPAAHFNLGLMYMTAGPDFPGLDTLGGLQKAIDEFTRYRTESGAKLAKDDPSGAYLEELGRQVEREKKRIEREKARAAKEAAKAQSSGGSE
ncbi:MAG: tetratricopeptide repeat protein [Polyangiales bacterium]|nr:tetratricopeptide repeat protein [Myxococcales bacterium]